MRNAVTLINGYAHVEHNGHRYFVSPLLEVIYVRIALGIEMRSVKWDGPTGRIVRAIAGLEVS